MSEMNNNGLPEKNDSENVVRRNDDDYKVKESRRMNFIIAIFAVLFAIFMWMYAVSNPGTSQSETKPSSETTAVSAS